MTEETLQQNILETGKKLIQFRELLELYVVNGLVKGIYKKPKELPRKPPESNDTFSRLEALANPPPPEMTKPVFLGAFLPLGLEENCDWLCVLTDGTIIRLTPPEHDQKRIYECFKEKFLQADNIFVEKERDISSSPLNYFWNGKIVYRNDLPQEEELPIEQDLQKAFEISQERKRMIDKQKEQGVKSFLKIFSGNPRSTSDQSS